MKTLKLGLRNMRVADKIQKARAIVSCMDGNVHFPGPNPTLAEVAAATLALENAYDKAQDRGRTAIAMLRQCEAAFDGIIKMLGAYVQIASAGDEAIIVSSGFEAVRRGTPTSAPTTNPCNVRGKNTWRPGEVIIRWNAANGAKIYIAQMSSDGSVWIECGTSTQTKLIVSGLVRGTKPLFRVIALGRLGYSGWSEPCAVDVDL